MVLLLARPRLHVTAVALRTAVLVVLTAHRLKDRRRTGLRRIQHADQNVSARLTLCLPNWVSTVYLNLINEQFVNLSAGFNSLLCLTLTHRIAGGQTLTRGQQPHSPVFSLQQVVPVGQLLLSSHLTSVRAPG